MIALTELALPLIVAPMTKVSGPELTIAACRSGVIGSFPTHNAHSTEELGEWLTRIAAADLRIPFAANVIAHRSNDRRDEDVACLVEHGVELVIASVGAPGPIVEPLHRAGCQVYADVASLRHLDRALESGVDGLVLLTAGAGGQTGWANPFSFVRAVRARFDGPIVLAGGISDGAALWAARVLGADLGYMGTKFIATTESLAGDEYRSALVDSTMDDVTTSAKLTGLPTNVLRSWLDSVDGDQATSGFDQQRLLDPRDAWSAGHSVSGVTEIRSATDLIAQTRQEYELARKQTIAAATD
ncbi:NAD(P)H-dependent flavin oxidoreductase [Nocardia altamirensis]|uniref:NAD(P)H-dependent flavin oxidoreductase n=1 Tax=Nocardia altamirensis TaxID=472158 RepID=UPI0008404598|nr:nitronate monooxygenase [Nocardia altamirensis]